jgi:hypothetical protein
LPHASSQIAKHEQFRHGLLADSHEIELFSGGGFP